MQKSAAIVQGVNISSVLLCDMQYDTPGMNADSNATPVDDTQSY